MGRQKVTGSRILAAFLALILVIGLLPTTAMGAMGGDTYAETDALTLSQLDASWADARLLSKGIDAKSNLTAARSFTSEELSYVESVAQSFTEPVGVYGLDGVGGNETVRVFVWLQSLPNALERVYVAEKMDVKGYTTVKKIANDARAAIRNSASQRVSSLKVIYEYSEVFSGFAVEATMSQIREIAAMAGVYMVTEVGYDVMDAYTPDPGYSTVGNGAAREIMDIDELHAAGIDGTGVKVGVIDSGIDATHPEFAGAYKGGYNFADKTADMTKQDGNHGTHVSGTIASQGIKSLGVAPGVELYMAQVFTQKRPNSADQADVAAAIEDFSADGGYLPKVDIINMSLGNDSNTAYGQDHFVRNNAIIAGVLIVNSAGNNAYPDTTPANTTDRKNYTLGSGGVSLPLSVAASKYGGDQVRSYDSTAVSNGEGKENIISVTIENKDGSISGLYGDGFFGSVDTHSVTFTAANVTDDTNTWLLPPYLGTYVRHPLVFVEGKGYELYYACSTAGEMTVAELDALKAMPKDSLIGKILVVNRGQNFTDYLGEALRLGAGALVILNRDPTYISNMLPGNMDTYHMPVLSGPVDGKQKLLDVVDADGKAYLSPGNITKTHLELEPADFSSIGPVNETAQIKPDVIAPGWDIVSTSLNGEYATMSGTSMSSPFVAGVAALVKQQYPNATPAEIKARIMNTADKDQIKPLSSRLNNPGNYFNASGTETSVFEQGAGFVNPKRAVYDEVYITVANTEIPTGETNKNVMTAQMGSFSFGNVTAGSDSKKLTATVHGSDDVNISVVYNNNTRYSRSSEGAVKVNYEIDGNTFDVWLTIDKNAPSTMAEGNLFEGYILVTSEDKTYTLPWAVRVGEAPSGGWLLFPDRPIQATYNAANLEYSPYSRQNFYFFGFDGNEIADSVVLRRSGTTYYFDILLFNVNNPDVPAYRYQFGMGTASSKLSDYLVCDGRIYNFTNPSTAQAYARNTNGTWATNVSNVAAGSYYVGLEFTENGENYYDYFYELGVTFTSTRPTLTVNNATTSSTAVPSGNVTLTANSSTYSIYEYGASTYTVTGRIYSPAINEAMNAGETGFYWAGYYLLEYGVIVPLDQGLNVFEDVALLGYLYEEGGNPWICDEDGNFSMTFNTPTTKTNAYLFNYNKDSSIGIVWTPSGTYHNFAAVDAYDITRANNTQYGTIGNMVSFSWTPYVRQDTVTVSASASPGSIVAGMAANLKMTVNVTAAVTVADRVEVFLSKDGAQVGPTYTTTVGQTYVKIDAAPESGKYTVETRVYAGNVLLGSSSSPLEILDQPQDLWNPVCAAIDGKPVVMFADQIAPAPAGYVVTVNGIAVAVEQTGESILALDLPELKKGDKIVVTGVKFPRLYPSYAFSFKLVAP